MSRSQRLGLGLSLRLRRGPRWDDNRRRRRRVGMNTHVDADLLRLAKSSTTDVALERFFARMSSDVLP